MEPKGRVVGVEDYSVIKARLKNISPVFARGVNLFVGDALLKPVVYQKGFQPTGFDSMAELEAGADFEFLLHLGPDLWGNVSKLNCKLVSYNFKGDKFEQSVIIHNNQGSISFEMAS